MADPFSSFVSSLADNLFANYRQKDQQAFNAQQFATRYQTTVEDMKSAGLNPMLAFGGGGGGVGSGASSGISSSSGSFSAANAAYQENARQEELNKGQLATLKSQEDLNGAAAAKTREEARSAAAKAAVDEKYAMDMGALGYERGLADLDLVKLQAGSVQAQIQNILAQTGLTAAQTDVAMQSAQEIAARIKNIPKEGDRLEAAAKELHSQAELNRQRSISEKDQRNLLVAQAIKVAVDSDLSKLDLRAASDTSNVQRIVKQFGPAAQLLLDVLNYMKPRGGITINR